MKSTKPAKGSAKQNPDEEVRVATTWRGAKEITIAAGEYTGDFTVDGRTLHGSGPASLVTVFLLPDYHEIGFRSGYFLIKVDVNGDISYVGNPAAARAEGNKLILNTQRITIDPGDFGKLGGKCEFINCPSERFGLISAGARKFDVVTGVLHQFDTGARIGPDPDKKNAGSYLSFLVRQDGTVWSNSSAANGSGNILRLNSGMVKIEPCDPLLKYEVGVNCRKDFGPDNDPKYYKGTKDVPVILGLRTSLRVPPRKVGSKTYAEAVGYFNPEYGFHDRRELVVGNACFHWTVQTETR